MIQVYLKELLELVRDRKTLFFMIALPLIIFPVIFALMGVVVANVAMDEQKKVLNYAIVNESHASEFSEQLFYHRDFKKVELTLSNEAQIKQAITSGEVDLVIEISEQHQTRIAKHQTDNWRVYYNDASQMNQIRQKINKVFLPYLNTIRSQYMAELNLDESAYQALRHPVELTTVDTANERENIGEKVGGFIPYMLIVLCLTGAMYPAIDIGAGEKERGTLETLLLTPISRSALVLGKFCTIMTTALLSAFITVFSLVLWSFVFGEIADIDAVRRILSSVGWEDIILMFVMLIPVSSIFAALLLAISIYARSYKEAQNYMGPMTMLGFFPVMIAMLPGVKLDSGWALVPITNVALAIKEILKGTIDYAAFFAIFGSTLIFAFLSIAFCVYWFKKEAVLFR